jgi:hypothetical protein
MARLTRWVIFARPQQHGGPGSLFIAGDGTKTESREKAEKFNTAQAAKDFAKRKNITLDGAMTYIGQMDFTDFEIQSR